MATKNDWLKECLIYLQIPSLPKKEWDGESEFNKGIGLVERISKKQDYVICRYIPEKDMCVRVIKDFSGEPFLKVLECYPMPDYADVEIDSMQLDEQSKAAMEMLIEERNEKISEDVQDEDEKLPDWIFPFINNKEEAVAYLKSQGVKVPAALKSEDKIKAKLYVLYQDKKQHGK
jgi:hypothetical protein